MPLFHDLFKSNPTQIEVYVAICPDCKIGLYSRTYKDTRKCPCKIITVTGGTIAGRILHDPRKLWHGKLRVVTNYKLPPGVTKKILHQDWLLNINQYGTVKDVDTL